MLYGMSALVSSTPMACSRRRTGRYISSQEMPGRPRINAESHPAMIPSRSLIRTNTHGRATLLLLRKMMELKPEKSQYAWQHGFKIK